MQIIEIEKEDIIYPMRLKKIKNSPQKLYAVGNIELLQNKLSIAVVGSRKCSRYGQTQCFKFARKMAQEGLTIISGMALGIDTVAHLAAVGQVGNTIAVLGSGFNYIFPEENEYLFYKILNKGGCIISEYPPEEKKQSSNFPKRNRIISALASKVLVIEAASRSGSLITARLAKKEGKEVLALPSDLDKRNGEGTNELILKGATLVTNPKQIITKIKEEEIKKNENESKEELQAIKIPKQYETVYQLLEKEEKYVNEMSKVLKIPLTELSEVLMLMELEGYIEKTEQNQYQIKRR